MKNTYKYLLLLIVIAALVLVISSFTKNAPVDTSSDEVIATALYTDANGQEIPAEYTDGKVTINFNGEVMTLNQVISGSGARYANDDESFVFWNKGDEATVYVNDAIVFEGIDSQSLEEEQAEEVLPQEENSKSYLGSWEWAETVYPTDEGGAAPQPKSDKFVLTLNEDGTVNGTTDCNGFTGSYTVTNGTITFGDGFASTLKYCEGSQEAEFTSLLQRVQSIFQPNADSLVLELPLDSGQVIFKKK